MPSQRTRENLSNEKHDLKNDLWRESIQRGEYVDQFTTIEPEPYEKTLARLPRCCQSGYVSRKRK